jgi:heme/copper-type cytochrome/quinol oxidase subunit 2
VHSIPNDQVAHTFTIPGLLINVPIPAAKSSSHPVTVTFTFRVTKKGTFNWLCEAPCGSGKTGMGGAMNTAGWMVGHVTFT